MPNTSIQEIQKQEYTEMVKQLKPRPRIWRNVFWAFMSGLYLPVGQFYSGFSIVWV
jgi:hypothetical protein